ncbi:MAG: FIST N-terminal domain-containing protein [Rhodothermales bacterium]|nr:FIST N-terminal domain-containing protein [Rhodothermales bacterium]
MIVALGHSEDLDSADAIDEALDRCAETLSEKTPQAGLLFAGIDHDHQALLDGVEARYPGLQLIGGTTHGELSSEGFAEDSVALMLFHSERVAFRAGVGEGVRADPEGAARRAVATAKEGLTQPVRLGLTVPEGLGLDMKVVTDTLHAAIGPDASVCGGLAGDQIRFEQTYQFCNGRVYSDAVPVLLFTGPLRVATGVASGWVPMGEAHRLTKTEGQTIIEIDGEPAREVWDRYFGSFAIRGSRNQFAIYPDGAEGNTSREFYLCAPSHFQEDGSLVMLNPVIQDARLRFTDATREQVLEGAGTSAAAARAGYEGTPDAALVFSCAGRHAWLGTQIGRELGLLQEHIGTAVPAVGFYTYGEICPLPGAPTPYTHGTTFVTVLIGEEA